MIDRINRYIEQIDITENISSSVDEDIYEYLRKKCDIKDKKKIYMKMKEIKEMLKTGGIIDE
jgi:hypothetical protein